MSKSFSNILKVTSDPELIKNPSKLITNLRQVAKENSAANQGAKGWDPERISEVLEARWAGLDKSENPEISLNVQIPRTPSVVKIKTGKYKLDNDTNITGINNGNALHIVGNTYQDNDDGSYYGMGWDGRPYSYTIKDNIVGNFTPLGVDEQKKAVNRLSNGRISINDTINNPATIAEVYRSVKRMKDNGKGNLIPDHVVIGDSNPGRVTLFGGSGLMGEAVQRRGTKESQETINLLGSDFPGTQAAKSNRAKDVGFHPAGGGDAVPQHELAHTAEYALLDSPQRYYDRVAEDAKKYKGKYSAGDLWEDAIGKIKYAIPTLMDSVFGTNFVPSEEELYKMWRSENLADQNAGAFWADYYLSPEHKYDTVEKKILKNAGDKIDKWYEKYSNGNRYEAQTNLFKKAAENTGFDSVEAAVASVSDYALNNDDEAFAEAYSDVLLNGDDAKPFSKELIRLYSEVADDTAKMFGKNKKPIQLQALNQLFDVLPPTKLGGSSKLLKRIRQNARR